jgi:hypothetical protein
VESDAAEKWTKLVEMFQIAASISRRSGDLSAGAARNVLSRAARNAPKGGKGTPHEQPSPTDAHPPAASGPPTRERWHPNPDRQFSPTDMDILKASDVIGSTILAVAKQFEVSEYYVNQVRRDWAARAKQLGMPYEPKPTGRKYQSSLGLRYFAVVLGSVFGDLKIARMLGIDATSPGKWRKELGFPPRSAVQAKKSTRPPRSESKPGPPPQTSGAGKPPQKTPTTEPEHPSGPVDAWGDWDDVQRQLARRRNGIDEP